MKMCVSYFDHVIDFDSSMISVLEVENRQYFYDFIKKLFFIQNGQYVEEIRFFSNSNEELNNISIKVVVNYFDYSFDSKKISNGIMKLVASNIGDKDRVALSKSYKKICDLFNSILENIDFPLLLHDDFNIDNLIKMLKIEVVEKDNLLGNLFLLMDISKNFENNDLFVFVNLKQYLNKEELNELYKYSIYNGILILLVDSQAYGVSNEYEKKLLIDGNLDEFML